MKKRKVEIFTAGCPVCEPVVQQVKSIACPSCEITIYNLTDTRKRNEHLEKIKEYNITSLPAVAVNGQLLTCFSSPEINYKELKAAGIGNEL